MNQIRVIHRELDGLYKAVAKCTVRNSITVPPRLDVGSGAHAGVA
ncbi:hypothetical protein ACGFNU_44555 [Spirillospora sp. NPDC048911]